jgi:hypothetical protein
MGLPMALMCVFLIVAVIGLVVLRGANNIVPGRSYSQDKLFPIFLERLSKEYPPVHVVYLSPWQVKQMKRQ